MIKDLIEEIKGWLRNTEVGTLWALKEGVLREWLLTVTEEIAR